MPRRRGERGEGNLGCILWLLALGLAILIAWKMIPIKIATSQLYDFMEEQAKFAFRPPPEAIAKGILDKAKELELPVTKDDIHVEKPGDKIRMHVEYTVPVEFPGYTYMWHFDQTVNRDIFVF